MASRREAAGSASLPRQWLRDRVGRGDPAFPDCRAHRSVGKGRWQPVRIEFEFMSRNFKTHGHDPKGCDLIVCWEDNWGKAAPVPVLELKNMIRRLVG